MNKSYYTQTFLEECKYSVKKIKNIINEELEVDSSDENDDFNNDNDLMNLINLMKKANAF